MGISWVTILSRGVMASFRKSVSMSLDRALTAGTILIIVPAGTIIGAEIIESNSFGLYGCMVTPGFEFDDFEVFNKEDLIQAYPKHAELIEKFG